MKQSTDFQKSRILIVDDEKSNVWLLKRLLKRQGFHNLEGTSDPREGCELYRKFRPNLMLLDLKMPQMDGFQVMEELHRIEKNGTLPVMVITALKDKETRERVLRAGALDVLPKPLNFEKVLNRVRKVLDVSPKENEDSVSTAQLKSRVEKLERELGQTQIQFLHCLGRAAEYRDNETGNHIIRLSHFSALLGGEVGLSADECNLLLNASPMHDIGKIGIPDRILLKPGKLDPDEWEIMKTHTIIGGEILSGGQSDLLKMAQVIALQHHEQWDGGGYPHGLKGEEISLWARIVSICDVYDALTSKRPYKEAWSVDRAMQEIRKKSGSHFDPRLVEKFQNILPQVVQVGSRFSD